MDTNGENNTGRIPENMHIPESGYGTGRETPAQQPQTGQEPPAQPPQRQAGVGPGSYAGQYAPPGAWQPPPYGYGAAVPVVPKRRGGMRAFMAILLVACLLGGAAAGVFLIAPYMNAERISQAPPLPTLAPPDEQAGEEPPIGGKAPDINMAASPIVQIAKEVGPAIVGVTVSVDEPQGQEIGEAEIGYGTGIIVREDGYIVTNNHVVPEGGSVRVTLSDATKYDALVVGKDVATDLAVLKIDADGLMAAALGDSDALEVGEGVVAIGNPLGAEFAGSVTSGIVSALNREIKANGYSQNYIQTDAAINPGNSGGALVNMRGEVIGINTLKSYLAGYDNYGVPIGTEGIGFAIPISSARPIIEQLIATENLGIGITCLVDRDGTYNPPGSPAGVTVTKVVKGRPADLAGLMARDIITSADGTKTETPETLIALIKSKQSGDAIVLTIWRAGREHQATVTVRDYITMR